MLINKETDYALRVFRVLADGGRMSVPEICKLGQMPTGFTHKIVQKLTAAGYLDVTRGSKGGCLVIADLNLLTLYDVMEAIGENGIISACVNPEYQCTWRAKNHCICTVNCNMIALQNNIDELLKKHTVASLVGHRHVENE
ncbi:MAG: Rrf2 family transcriptional regulator [Oscillospiraceae bacterium]